MQDEAAPGFDRTAEVDVDTALHLRVVNAQLLEKIIEGQRFEDAIDDEAHRAFGAVGAQVDDGLGEARIAHARHGDEQVADQIAVEFQSTSHRVSSYRAKLSRPGSHLLVHARATSPANGTEPSASPVSQHSVIAAT